MIAGSGAVAVLESDQDHFPRKPGLPDLVRHDRLNLLRSPAAGPNIDHQDTCSALGGSLLAPQQRLDFRANGHAQDLHQLRIHVGVFVGDVQNLNWRQVEILEPG